MQNICLWIYWCSLVQFIYALCIECAKMSTCVVNFNKIMQRHKNYKLLFKYGACLEILPIILFRIHNAPKHKVLEDRTCYFIQQNIKCHNCTSAYALWRNLNNIKCLEHICLSTTIHDKLHRLYKSRDSHLLWQL